MQLTRRQLVGLAATAVAVPLDPGIAWTRLQAADGAQPPEEPSRTVDPVMAEIEASVARIDRELRASPSRLDAARAFEQVLRLQVAHAVGNGMHRRITTAVRREIARRGSAMLAHDLVARGRRDARREAETGSDRRGPSRRQRRLEVTAVDVERAVEAVARLGYSGVLAQTSAAVAGIVSHQRQGMGVAAVTTRQPDECHLMREALDMLQAMTLILCGLAIVDPVLIPMCALLMVEVGIAELVYWVSCEMWF